MKYFDSLPKNTFESSIGSYQISDFFTYIDWSNFIQDFYMIEYDDHTTLIEAAFQTYGDPDSFWTFLISNNSINPFLIAQTNIENFKKQQEQKLNVALSGSTAGITSWVFPAGSIILNYTSNTGASSAFSSVGNFDLNGGFVLVETPFFYSGTMNLKDSKVSAVFQNGITGNQTVVLYPDSNNNYQIQKLLYTKTSRKTNQRTSYTINPSTGKTVVEEKTTKSSGGKNDDEYKEKTTLDEKTQDPAVTIEYTVEDVISNTETKIKAYSIQFIGTLKSNFITAKYI